MRGAWLLLAAAVVAADAQAQLLPYESDDERFGASLVFPIGRREFIRKMVEYCGAKYEDLRVPSQAAYAHWVRRNGAFLRMTDSMRRYLTQRAEKDATGKGAEWKKLLGEYIPQQIERLSSVAMQAIADMPSEEARRGLCARTIESLDALKLELDRSDPELAGYLRGIAAKNNIEIPPAGTDPTAGASGARRDAAALPGRWKTGTVLYYFADGTQRRADGTCTLTFARDSAASACDGPRGAYDVRYAFRADDAGHYDSEILEHTANPKAAGARASGLFRVEGGTLHISVFPLSAGGDGQQPLEIESVAERQEVERK